MWGTGEVPGVCQGHVIPCCYSPGGMRGGSPYLGCERACPRCSPRLPNRGQATLLAIRGTAFQAFLHSWRFSTNSYERLRNLNAEGTATTKSFTSHGFTPFRPGAPRRPRNPDPNFHPLQEHSWVYRFSQVGGSQGQQL